MKELSVDQATGMIIAICDAIIENEPLLTEMDSRIGDGDHGIGMSGGMSKVKSLLMDEGPFDDVTSLFRTTGMTLLNSMGGASGVLFGILFFGGTKGLPPSKTLDGKLLATIMRGSLEAIKDRGGAQPGDKTMIDAFEPAVIALEEMSHEDDLVSILQRAKNAAKQGAENTKNYVAKFGRAKSLMERAIGYEDPGAVSVAIIFDAMHQYVL